jgi:hypothetical protein
VAAAGEAGVPAGKGDDGRPRASGGAGSPALGRGACVPKREEGTLVKGAGMGKMEVPGRAGGGFGAVTKRGDCDKSRACVFLPRGGAAKPPPSLAPKRGSTCTPGRVSVLFLNVFVF